MVYLNAEKVSSQNDLFRTYCLDKYQLQLYTTSRRKGPVSKNTKRAKLFKLDDIQEYTSRTPFTKTYEFQFNNSENRPYALVFYINESSFSNSVIKHRKPNELHRHAIRIDENIEVLTALDKHLPKPDTITWQQVAKQIERDDARDGYYMLQEYIRYKIREL